MHWLLAREGLVVNHKRTERLYREEQLAVRRRRRKHASEPRVVPAAPVAPTERWSMDVVRDTFADGRPSHAFTVVDDFTRESPVIAVDTHLSSERLIAVLEELGARRDLPGALAGDHSPEFTSRAFDAWAYRRGIKLLFIRPSKPVDNAFIESFNGKRRDECLSVSWFFDLADARLPIEHWRRDYHGARPHSGRADATPERFANAFALTAASTDP